MKFDRADALLLLLCALLLMAACLPWMASLGMEYDEAHFLDSATRIAVGHPEKLKPPDGFYVFRRPFPFMTMAYVGAVDGWLLALPLRLFGFHQTVSRSVNLAAGFLVLVLAYGLAKRLGGRSAAIVTAALLLVDFEFLIHVPVHFGPFLIQMIAAVLVVWLIDRWLETGQTKLFFWACFWAGFAFQEKLTFVWFLGLYVVALLAFDGRAVFRRLTWRTFVIGLGIFLLSMLPVLWYTLGRPEVVLGFGKSAASAPAGWSVLSERFRMFHVLLMGQEFARLQLGDPTVSRFSALAWLFWGGFALAAIQRQKKALMFFAISVALVALNALFPEGGRLHHLMLTYPLLQIGVALAVTKARPVLAIAALAIAATGVSTAQNLAWYTETARRTGGQNHWSSAIYDLAAWMRENPAKQYTSSAWGFYRPLYTLTEGKISIRDRYFELLPDPLPEELHRDISNIVRRRGTYWITSSIQPQYDVNLTKLFAIAGESGLRPSLIKTFATRGGQEIYRVYSFHPDQETAWRPAPGQRGAGLSIEIELPVGANDVRFQLPAAHWRRGITLSIELAGADKKRLAAWWRTVEHYPLIWPEERFEFGPDLFPDYFVPLPDARRGEARYLRIVVESKRGPVDFRVENLEVR